MPNKLGWKTALLVLAPPAALFWMSFAGSVAAQDRPLPATPAAPVRLSDAPAPVVAETVAIVVSREEETGERLIGSVQLSGRVVPASGEQRPVRVLAYSLHLQREWRADGPMFNFVNQRIVEPDDSSAVLTGKAGTKVKSTDGKSEEFVSYAYQIRPRTGLTWGAVAGKDDVLIELQKQ
jgi:hypothetical protein